MRLNVAVFIQVRFGSLGRTKGSSGSFGFAWVGCGVYYGFAWVNPGATRGRRSHWGSRGLTPACLCRRVHLGSRGFTGAGLVVVMFIWVHSGAPECRGLNSCSCAFIQALIAVLGSIRVCVGSGTLGSSGFAWFHSFAHRRGGVVHSVSLRFTWAVVRFILVRVGSLGQA